MTKVFKTMKEITANTPFRLRSGNHLGSLYDLYTAMQSISKPEFDSHVSTMHNDFAAWVHDALHHPQLAQMLGQVKTIDEHLTILYHYAKELASNQAINLPDDVPPSLVAAEAALLPPDVPPNVPEETQVSEDGSSDQNPKQNTPTVQAEEQPAVVPGASQEQPNQISQVSVDHQEKAQATAKPAAKTASDSSISKAEAENSAEEKISSDQQSAQQQAEKKSAEQTPAQKPTDHPDAPGKNDQVNTAQPDDAKNPPTDSKQAVPDQPTEPISKDLPQTQNNEPNNQGVSAAQQGTKTTQTQENAATSSAMAEQQAQEGDQDTSSTGEQLVPSGESGVSSAPAPIPDEDGPAASPPDPVLQPAQQAASPAQVEPADLPAQPPIAQVPPQMPEPALPDASQVPGDALQDPQTASVSLEMQQAQDTQTLDKQALQVISALLKEVTFKPAVTVIHDKVGMHHKVLGRQELSGTRGALCTADRQSDVRVYLQPISSEVEIKTAALGPQQDITLQSAYGLDEQSPYSLVVVEDYDMIRAYEDKAAKMFLHSILSYVHKHHAHCIVISSRPDDFLLSVAGCIIECKHSEDKEMHEFIITKAVDMPKIHPYEVKNNRIHLE